MRVGNSKKKTKKHPLPIDERISEHQLVRPVLFTVHTRENAQGGESHQEPGGPHAESACRTGVPLGDTTGHSSDVTAKQQRRRGRNEAERSQNDAAVNK